MSVKVSQQVSQPMFVETKEGKYGQKKFINANNFSDVEKVGIEDTYNKNLDRYTKYEYYGHLNDGSKVHLEEDSAKQLLNYII